jgi:hypothetical protein
MNFSSTSGIAVEEHVPTAFPCNDRRACSRSVSCRPVGTKTLERVPELASEPVGTAGGETGTPRLPT